MSEGLPYRSRLKSITWPPRGDYTAEEQGWKQGDRRLLQQSRAKMMVAGTEVSKWGREEVRAAKKLAGFADGLSDVGYERR